jgi:hypothetical protein
MLWRWNWINSSWLGSCWLKRRNKGVELVGPNGLLNQLTKNVLETALDAEVTEPQNVTLGAQPGLVRAELLVLGTQPGQFLLRGLRTRASPNTVYLRSHAC